VSSPRFLELLFEVWRLPLHLKHARQRNNDFAHFLLMIMAHYLKADSR